MFGYFCRKVVPGSFRTLGGGVVRLEVGELKHLHGSLVVLAEAGVVTTTRFGRTREEPAVSVWCVSAVRHLNKIKATSGTPLYHGLFVTDDVRGAMKDFIVAINKPNASDRIAALGM